MTIVKRIIKRLLLYKLYLHRFRELGFETIFSYNLGEAAGVSAVQVRKDFSEFGIRGNKRGGYNIDLLLKKLNDIFGYSRKNIIIIGMGNIGKALAQYNPRFLNKKIQIVAGFDIDPSKIKKKNFDIPVYPLSKIEEIVKSENITTAVIAVPFQTSQEVCNKLVSAGIKSILNFSPIMLKVPDEVVVNDINLSNELESIIYNIDNI